MSYDPDIHKRHSLRLKNYDYAREGAYFVTICTSRRLGMLGEVIEGKVREVRGEYKVRPGFKYP
ncbi:hypothetical protein [Geoalkalibacter halelectricus]|uniref:hypothetical protein n=1 Tax=Geoalkalibacter halelectricus TaxID=2847045 RepID=UPI003D261538